MCMNPRKSINPIRIAATIRPRRSFLKITKREKSMDPTAIQPPRKSTIMGVKLKLPRPGANLSIKPRIKVCPYGVRVKKDCGAEAEFPKTAFKPKLIP